MLLARETVDAIELSVLSALLGIIPYAHFADALSMYSGITEQDRARITEHLSRILFAKYHTDLDALAINKNTPPPPANTTQRAPAPNTQRPTSVVEQAIAEHPAYQKKFAALPEPVRTTIASGPIALGYSSIPNRYATAKEHTSAIQQHILGVLVGAETMQQFRETIRETALVRTDVVQEFFSECEMQLFKPVRRSILQSLEQRG